MGMGGRAGVPGKGQIPGRENLEFGKGDVMPCDCCVDRHWTEGPAGDPCDSQDAMQGIEDFALGRPMDEALMIGIIVHVNTCRKCWRRHEAQMRRRDRLSRSGSYPDGADPGLGIYRLILVDSFSDKRGQLRAAKRHEVRAAQWRKAGCRSLEEYENRLPPNPVMTQEDMTEEDWEEFDKTPEERERQATEADFEEAAYRDWQEELAERSRFLEGPEGETDEEAVIRLWGDGSPLEDEDS